MNKIRKDDEVIITAGRDRGRRGTVLRIVDDRLLVEGVNMVSKHLRGNPQQNIVSKINRQEAFIHRSNVAIFNSVTGSGDRVAIKVLEDGRKVRIFRSTGEVVDV